MENLWWCYSLQLGSFNSFTRRMKKNYSVQMCKAYKNYVELRLELLPNVLLLIQTLRRGILILKYV